MAKDNNCIAAVQFEIKLIFFLFSTRLHRSVILFIWTYTVTYQNALDSHRAPLNIKLILLQNSMKCFTNNDFIISRQLL